MHQLVFDSNWTLISNPEYPICDHMCKLTIIHFLYSVGCYIADCINGSSIIEHTHNTLWGEYQEYAFNSRLFLPFTDLPWFSTPPPLCIEVAFKRLQYPASFTDSSAANIDSFFYFCYFCYLHNWLPNICDICNQNLNETKTHMWWVFAIF